MIDEKLTYEKFGYYSTELTFKSAKLIITRCDDCQRIKECKKCNYEMRCHSCAGKRMWNTSKKFISKRLLPTHCIDCGKKISKTSIRCKSCAMRVPKRILGIKYKNYGFKKEYLNQEYVINKKSTIKIALINNCSEETIRCYLKKYKINRRKENCANVYLKYKLTWLRSNWEYCFARFLTLSGIKWKYESKTFDLGNTTYTPDFYLPEFDCYIEIKGWWRNNSKKKFKKFKQVYKNIYIKLLMKKELQQLGVLV